MYVQVIDNYRENQLSSSHASVITISWMIALFSLTWRSIGIYKQGNVNAYTHKMEVRGKHEHNIKTNCHSNFNHLVSLSL